MCVGVVLVMLVLVWWVVLVLVCCWYGVGLCWCGVGERCCAGVGVVAVVVLSQCWCCGRVVL